MIFHRILTRLLLFLALTVVLEAVLSFLCGVRSGRGQLIVLLANVMTNPPLNCILTVVSFYLSPQLYYVFLIPLEFAVVGIEGLIYKKTLHPELHPFVLSLLLNAGSFVIGTGILKIIQ